MRLHDENHDDYDGGGDDDSGDNDDDDGDDDHGDGDDIVFLRSSTSTIGTQILWSNCDFLACAPVLVGIRSGASSRNSVIAIRNLLNFCLDQQSDNIYSYSQSCLGRGLAGGDH